jgi:hypothetical protein
LLCLAPFLWGKVRDPSAGSLLSLCCDGLLIVNFAVSFDLGCCSLAQEMSFVDCYVPYFRQQLITHPLSALLPFQSLFIKRSHGDQLLALPPPPVHLQHPTPSVACSFSVPCLLFGFCCCCCCCFAGQEVNLSRGYAFLSQGWLWEYHMMLGAHLLVCQMSPKQV